MNDLRRYINLIESVELSEAPIDDFKRAADKDLGISKADGDSASAATLGFFVFGAIGSVSPWFMDLDFTTQVMSSIFAGFGLGVVGGTLGIDSANTDFDAVSDKKRKYAEDVLKGKAINPEIISDLKKFNNYLVNNIPSSISVNALELKDIIYNHNSTHQPDLATYAPSDWLDVEYGGADQTTFHKRVKKVIELIEDYLKKSNIVYDNLAKKHGLTPLQLGAIQYLHLEDEIEETFLNGIQSKLSG